MALPQGWFLAGPFAKLFEAGVDTSEFNTELGATNGSAGYLRRKIHSPVEVTVPVFGTLMQSFEPVDYRGKRIRLTSYVKYEVEEKSWCCMWMRIDGANQLLKSDTMHDRKMQGKSSWKQVEIVLECPPESSRLSFGIALIGSGSVWVDDFGFEIVDATVQETGENNELQRPVNLSF